MGLRLKPKSKQYIVVGSKTWNRRTYDEIISHYPGTWTYCSDPAALTLDALKKSAPRYIFFLHWSARIPAKIVELFECICFHMADLPYGRGGSPLQNLLMRGHRETKISCFRMTHDLDAGPVYMKKPLCLSGNAEEIYIQADHLAAEMILEIVELEPEPVPQSGKVAVFHRRRPDESEIPSCKTLENLYDFLRMLDAEGYPRAFLVHRGFRYELSRPVRYNGKIVADVTITKEEEM